MILILFLTRDRSQDPSLGRIPCIKIREQIIDAGMKGRCNDAEVAQAKLLRGV